MEALARFFARFVSLFVFLLLETVAMIMIIRGGQFQKAAFMSGNVVVGTRVYSMVSSLTDYVSLKYTNTALAQENANLQQQLVTLQSQLDKIHADSLQQPIDTPLLVIPAKVIYSTTNQLHNIIIIDKGSAHGISSGMGVIDCHGVVGVVRSVSENCAAIISALSIKLQISGKFKGNNYLCSVSWDGCSPRTGVVLGIPLHVIPAVGDTILTSGHSAIFPENIPIGIVKSITENSATAWCDLSVRYSAEFASLTFVNVIAYKNQQELLSLQKSMEE
jgi:rod shape-determining protein MreC